MQAITLILLVLSAATLGAGCTCTQPMMPDSGVDTGPRLDVGVPDVPDLPDAPVDVPGTDAGPPGALTVVGGFGTLPAASGGALTVVGGFGAAPACNGSLCVYGGFSR